MRASGLYTSRFAKLGADVCGVDFSARSIAYAGRQASKTNDKIREVCNWLQYFSPESLEREIGSTGLELEVIHGDVAGHSYDAGGLEFAAVLKRI